MTVKERKEEVRRQRRTLGIILLCALFYLAVSLWFLFHFMPKSAVNGVSVGGQSFESAAQSMQSAEEHYQLTVQGPENQQETIDGSDLEMKIEDASALKTAMRKQAAFGWPVLIFMEKEETVDLKVTYNETNLENAMNGLKMLDASAMTAPVDAKLDIDGNCRYVIVPETEGTTLDTDAAKRQIREAVERGLPDVDLTESQVLPEVRSTDENLLTRRDEWNSYIDCAGLTYQIAETEEKLTAPRIAAVLTDDGEHVAPDEKKISRLVTNWKSNDDTKGHSFMFKTSDGTEKRIMPWGDYGWSLDADATAADVMEKLQAKDTGTYDGIYDQEPLSTENNGLGDTYVEVSIYDQHLWVYKDGVCVVDTDVVTGKPVHGGNTSLGCYAIKRKDTDVVLGEEDVQGYEQPVNWFVPFNGGQGFHDAPWRESFGGKIWITNGSHGCVNVPEDVMGTVFDYLEVGEAVVVWGNDYDEGINDLDHTEVDEDYYFDVYYGDDDGS